MRKSDEFNVTIGVVAGYAGEDCLKQFKIIDKKSFNTVWQQKALQEYEKSGIYISGISTFGYALYNKEWGCPTGGEPVYSVTGARNPEFYTDSNKWKRTVKNVVTAVKEYFKQEAVTLTFREIEYCYLKED